MVGISEAVEKQLAAYPPEAVERWFGPRANFGEVRVRYARNAEGTDITSWLPSSRHMAYVAKGWTAWSSMKRQCRSWTESARRNHRGCECRRAFYRVGAGA